MIDAYGISIEDIDTQKRRMALAQGGYEASCVKRGLRANWDELDADERYLWFMTADALMKHDDQRPEKIAC